jgi:hypothetical protein
VQVRADPLRINWRSATPLGSFLAGNDSLVRYFSPLDEHLTSAYAYHCGTNERVDEAFDFILRVRDPSPSSTAAENAAAAAQPLAARHGSKSRRGDGAGHKLRRIAAAHAAQQPPADDRALGQSRALRDPAAEQRQHAAQPLPSSSAARLDTTCGSATPGPLAWIDVPTYWINLDSAVARAARMRAQLAAALTPSTCATRVPAVEARAAWRAVTGGALFSEGIDELRFASGVTTRLDIAITLSHLRAVHLARLQHGAAACWLVLEDDVDLAFFPTVAANVDGLLAARSARAFADALPAGWGIAQLMALQSDNAWKRMQRLWQQEGSRWAGALPTATLAAAYAGGMHPTEVWSAGAYLVSAEAGARWTELWPLALEPPPADREEIMESMLGDSFRVRIERVPWVKPHWRLVKEGALPLAPQFGPDVGFLHLHEFYGPPRSVDEATKLGAAASVYSPPRSGDGSAAAKVRSAEGGGGARLREYLATPPLIISAPVNRTDMSHAGDEGMHRKSREFVRRWWGLRSASSALPGGGGLSKGTSRRQSVVPTVTPQAAQRPTAAPSRAHIAFVLRAHSCTKRLWKELRRYARELEKDGTRADTAVAGGGSARRATYALFASVDVSSERGVALAAKLRGLESIGPSRVHTYSANQTLNAFPLSMAHLRLIEARVNWAFHIESMALWAAWAHSRRVEFTHAWFVEADVGFSGNLASFLRFAEEQPDAPCLAGRGGDAWSERSAGGSWWAAAPGGVRAVPRPPGGGLSDLLGLAPRWISGARYAKTDPRFWAHWNKSTPAFGSFFSNIEQRYRGPDQILRVSRRLLDEMARLSRDLGVCAAARPRARQWLERSVLLPPSPRRTVHPPPRLTAPNAGVCMVADVPVHHRPRASQPRLHRGVVQPQALRQRGHRWREGQLWLERPHTQDRMACTASAGYAG